MLDKKKKKLWRRIFDFPTIFPTISQIPIFDWVVVANASANKIVGLQI